MSGLKCVNLGLPKSGTTTFARALKEAGWLVPDHKVRRIHTKKPELAGTYVGFQLYRGYFSSGDPLEYLGLYDALGEVSAINAPRSYWPQCDYVILKALRERTPQVKFVSTCRPAADIADSMLRWGNLGTERLPTGTIPGMPLGFGRTRAELERWINDTYQLQEDVFADDPRYLRLCVGDNNAKEQLAAHLDVELPWWGRENINTENPPQVGAA